MKLIFSICAITIATLFPISRSFSQTIAEGFDHTTVGGIKVATKNDGEVIFRSKTSGFAWGGHSKYASTNIGIWVTYDSNTPIMTFGSQAVLEGAYIYTRFDSSNDGSNNVPDRHIDMSDTKSRAVLYVYKTTAKLALMLRDNNNWYRSSDLNLPTSNLSYDIRYEINPKTLTWTKLSNTTDMDEVDNGGSVDLTDNEAATPDWTTVEGMGLMVRSNTTSAALKIKALCLTDGTSNKANLNEPMKNSDIVFLHRPEPLEKFDEYGGAKIAFWDYGWDAEKTKRVRDYGVRDMPVTSMSVIKNSEAQAVPELKDAICKDFLGNDVIEVNPMFPTGATARMCIRKPAFLAYVKEYLRTKIYNIGAIESLMDCPTGSNGTKMLFRDAGGCLCDICNAEFTTWLKAKYTTQELADKGIPNIDAFNYKDYIKTTLGITTVQTYRNRFDSNDLPLKNDFIQFQGEPAREFYNKIRDYSKTLDPNFIFSSNTYNLVSPLLYLVEENKSDFHGAECEIYSSQFNTQFHVQMLRLKLADALGIRICTSATHMDFSPICTNNRKEVLKLAIAGHYASGHQLFVPDYYNWIEPDFYGSIPEFAPFFKFVRKNASLFDDYKTITQVGILYDNSVTDVFTGSLTFKNDYSNIASQLFENNIPFGVVAGADGTFLTKEFTKAGIKNQFEKVIEPRGVALKGNQLQIINDLKGENMVHTWTGNITTFLPKVNSWVTCDKSNIWVLPRRKSMNSTDPIVVHMYNNNLNVSTDVVTEKTNIKVTLRNELLGYVVSSVQSYSPDGSITELSFTNTATGVEISVPNLKYWNVLKVNLSDTPAAVGEIMKPRIAVYPNPANSQMAVTGFEGTAQINICSLSGATITSHNIHNGEMLDISSLPKGIYMLKVNEKNSVENLKIIKM